MGKLPMIKILLKHFIYEKCIDVLFDNIFFNFVVPDKKDRERWLENYVRNVRKSEKDYLLYEGRSVKIDPYLRKALTELKTIQIANGTFDVFSFNRFGYI